MRIALDSLPFDPITLQTLVRDLAGAVDEGQIEIDRLRQIIREFQRARFGRRAETLEPDQLLLTLETDTEKSPVMAPLSPLITETIGAAPIVKSPHRKALPEHLPRTDVTIPPDVTSCPSCGGALHDAGTTTSEMLDWVPASVRVVRINRPKCACRACGTLHQAPAPERIAEGCLATPGLIAHVLTSRYCDHLPLYRQSQMLARHGVALARSTLADWVKAAAWWLAPLRDQLMNHVCAAERVFADDTPLPILDPGRGRTKTGRLWAYTRDDRAFGDNVPPAVVFYATPDRTSSWPARHLKNYRGILQVDGYAGFEQLTRDGTVHLAACWAHTRRKFYELHQTGSPIATEALVQIRSLYEIEASLRGLPPDQRRTLREEHSRPRVEALALWLRQKLALLPSRARLAEAIRYALKRWDDLARFIENGRIDLDTNPVERAIRPVTLGRKNALFAGSEGGANRWAIVASLIETAKLNGIEPFAWLRDVLTRMIDGYPAARLSELLPFPQSANG
ncbi:IS66 family transposase [Gluconobacter kondonii]|uniref:Transposase n=3 Tax=Gluconobacter kondonii TaxID=941463 RepID=A0ABQ5WT66_9PROT|nr:IS66 family transposase [Gluconobacter kondonii]MCP1237158.1 IS66 family transposase [Gluconobacter kondonii]GLQ66728.1 transposase [Gluconobacter kondonii]